MLKLFKRKKNADDFVKGRIMLKVKESLRNTHVKLAAWMNDKTRHTSVITVKLCLALFCLVFGAAFLYVLVESIFGK